MGKQRRQWQPTPVLLPGKSNGRRSLVGCSPWGHGESDTTERLHFHFSLSCIGEGNGNPLQCSCLEYPRDGGAWWAAVYGVAQSQTRLKRLSSSSIRMKSGSNPIPLARTLSPVPTQLKGRLENQIQREKNTQGLMEYSIFSAMRRKEEINPDLDKNR